MKRGRKQRRAAGVGAAGAVALLAMAGGTFAQHPPVPRPATSASPTSTGQDSSLRAQLTSSVAQRLLRSPDSEQRLRGIRRLGSQNDYTAVQRLLQAIEDDAGLVSTSRLRLAAVRALSPFATRSPVRERLCTWAAETRSRGRVVGPLGELGRQQAAMALAATSHARAVENLVLDVIDGGVAGKRAACALIAHPPHDIEPLLRKTSLESPEVVDVLGRLGDLRSIPKLRGLLKEADLEVKTAAAVALARLGDASGVKLARDWLSQDGSSHALRVGAANTLTLTRDSLAPRAIAVLLADPATRDVGLGLAERAPTPQLAPTLTGLLTITEGATRIRVLAALARAGGPLAVKTLAGLCQRSPVDTDAAYALARCRDPAVGGVLSGMIAKPSHRRAGLRASLLRVAEGGKEPDGLGDTLASLAASRDPADRSVGVFGLVLTDRAAPETYAASRDVVSVLAACRATLGRSTAGRRACAARLSSDVDPLVRDGLAGAIPDPSAPLSVSTNTLMQWAESSRVSAPVFGRSLGPHDHETFRTRIVRLLSSGDPGMRAQVAIGLGHSPEASSASMLTDAYAFEADPWVRRAIIWGLAKRQSAVGRPWLERAAKLDPDAHVRTLARLALRGRPTIASPRGTRMLWLKLESSSHPESPAPRPVRVTMSSGFATVVVSAPDGHVLVPGITSGPVRVRVGYPPSSTKETEP